MQMLCFKQKVTFDNHKNIILNEEQGAWWGAYHNTYIKAHIAIYINVMGIVINSKKNTILVAYVMNYTLLPFV